MSRMKNLFPISRIKDILHTEIPLLPFKVANLVIIPLAIMLGGCYRVWGTAQTPFEEFAGVLLVLSFALLWAIYFGVLAPKRHSTEF